MNVADLAKDLGLPPSTLLDHCQQLGIKDAWAGTELSEIEQISLRSQLVDRNLLPRSERPLPPTAVGSLPGFDDPPSARGPGPAGSAGDDPKIGAAGAHPTEVDTTALRRDVVGAEKRIDHSVRPALVALALASIALAASEKIEHPVAVVALWIVAAVSLLTAFVAANRARYRITTHPEKASGLIVSVAVMVVSALFFGGLTVATWAVVRSAPAAQAPLGLGERSSVRILRWNYQRVLVIKEAGWQRPAKDAGTCWNVRDSDDPRRAGRIEIGTRDIDCNAEHDVEVLGVYRVNQDADVAYPGEDELQGYGLRRCAEDLPDSAGAADLGLRVEYPTEEGWADGDHDVSCVSTLTREGSVFDD